MWVFRMNGWKGNESRFADSGYVLEPCWRGCDSRAVVRDEWVEGVSGMEMKEEEKKKKC